jgi:hypothetical protein
MASLTSQPMSWNPEECITPTMMVKAREKQQPKGQAKIQMQRASTPLPVRYSITFGFVTRRDGNETENTGLRAAAISKAFVKIAVA